jgi:hypothetical protein
VGYDKHNQEVISQLLLRSNITIVGLEKSIETAIVKAERGISQDVRNN